MNKEKEREIKKIEETTYEKRKDGTMSIKKKINFYQHTTVAAL